jgi:RNA polymerase sigma factor (sigma-70 family)
MKEKNPAYIHKELIQACQEGNRKAQNKLYQLYSRAMFHICLRMLNDRAEAEDQLQHAFIDIFTKLHTFRFESSIGAWMKRIVIHKCINVLKKKSIQFDVLREQHLTFAEVEPNEPALPDVLLVREVKDAIAALPDGYRVVLSLYLLEGLDHEEISDVLGISVSTSKSQYHRARRKLKELLYSQ